MNTIQGKKIAIVGAGPGGLTLARLLQMRGADVAVYERDSSRDSRTQGATLDLHAESGLAAVEAAGLMDAFRANYRPGADRLLIADSQANVLYAEPSSEGSPHERPEIDRGPLRDLLIHSLHPETVHWDHRLANVVDEGGEVRLEFVDREAVRADLVIAADGANSRVRSAVTPIRPAYSGVMIIEGGVTNAAQAIPAIVDMLAGTFRAICAVGDSKSLSLGIKGDGSAAFYCGLKVPETWTPPTETETSTSAGRLGWFHKTCPGWSSFWDALFEHADKLVVRKQYVCPFDQHWQPKPNMTLIGDAAHVMPPYAGEGVNQAMLDALVLSRQLLSDTHPDTQAAIGVYEAEMFARTASIAQMTMGNTEIFHSTDAGQRLVDMFQQFASEREAPSAPQNAVTT